MTGLASPSINVGKALMGSASMAPTTPRKGPSAWWVKERYRPMRGYKRPESVLNVSSLLGWLGSQPGGELAELVVV